MYHDNYARTILIALVSVTLSLSSLSSAGDWGDVMEKIVIAGDDIFEWFPTGAYNTVENEFYSPAPGLYLIAVLKLGYHMELQSIEYQGTPLEKTVSVRKWW